MTFARYAFAAAFACLSLPALAADYTFKVAHTNAADEVQDKGLTLRLAEREFRGGNVLLGRLR